MPPVILVNIIIQLFDFIATYFGTETYGEFNPVMRYGFQAIGVLPTLVLAKSWALLVLYKLRNRPAAAPTLWGLAGFYTVLCVIPWTLVFVFYLTSLS